MSFMPAVGGNLCMFRMHADGEESPWTDAMAAILPIGKWSFVTMVYDGFSHISRIFIDGKYIAMHTDIADLGPVSAVALGGDIYQVSYIGDLSSFCVYNTALTSDEVMAFKEEAGFRGNEEPEGLAEYMVHDPAVYEDPDTRRYYLYCTEAQGWVSDDLVKWEHLGKVVEGVPKEAREWTGSDAIWAPDIVKVGDEYRLYCSNSSWGVQQSCIFLATSKKAEGPFIPKKAVLKTEESMGVNGIDAIIIEDNATGEQYMLYGSFWGGVHLLKLDKTTGYAKNENEIGICLARRPAWTSGAIEGPYMIYHPETKYYYLFVSYGSLKSDYNIRIGRSRKVTGPFLDYFGKDLKDDADENCTTGLMICAGYRWLSGMPCMGPGHNSVLLRKDGEMFLVCHIRKMRFLDDDPGAGFLQVRRLFLTPDGWLTASAQPYARGNNLAVEEREIPGIYERIELRPAIPQGIAHAHPLRLFEDGRMECCSVVGNWKWKDGQSIELSYGPITEHIHVERGFDRDEDKVTILFSGLTDQGICTWAKKKA